VVQVVNDGNAPAIPKLLAVLLELRDTIITMRTSFRPRLDAGHGAQFTDGLQLPLVAFAIEGILLHLPTTEGVSLVLSVVGRLTTP